MVHPRLRGKLSEYGFRSCTSVRFIPAYAGNSARFCAPVALDSVHPRLRGKLSFSARACCFSIGSSPLTRETLPPKENPLSSGRFIPAYAGNSVSLQAVQTNSLVHPRLRGKLNIRYPDSRRIGGSSPLTRETRDSRASANRRRRFIPAYAGNSLKMVTTLH